MRGMYWKPQGASYVQRALVAAIAVVGLIAVERFPTEERQPHYGEKLQAAHQALEAMEVIKEKSVTKGIQTIPETDPSGSGMVGQTLSPITSGSGSLVSKQTSVNPNFAAVVVEWLKELNIQNGDAVAVGVSGSFPAMNVAVYAALHTLGAVPIIITSTAASQYGANDPRMTWLDMEAVLREANVFPYTSIAASRGGVGDDAIGLTSRGQRMLDRAIDRNGIPKITPPKDLTELSSDQGYGSPPDIAAADRDKVLERLQLYRDAAGERPIKAYVNVGGGTVSVGTRVGKKKFLAGMNRRPPKGIEELPPSVIGAFLEADVPAIHVTRIIDIAERYGLEIAPKRIPEVGQGDVFQKRQSNRFLAAAVLGLIVFALLLIARAPWGTRLLHTPVTSQSMMPPPRLSEVPRPYSTPPSGESHREGASSPAPSDPDT